MPSGKRGKHMAKAKRSLIVLTLGILAGVMAFGVVGSAAWFTDQDTIKTRLAPVS